MTFKHNIRKTKCKKNKFFEEETRLIEEDTITEIIERTWLLLEEINSTTDVTRQKQSSGGVLFA